MCGRFINLTKTNTLKKIFNSNSLLKKDFVSYNISPSQNFCIIFGEDLTMIEEAKWGYSFFDKKNNLEKNIINSRLETIRDKVIFKESYFKRKCVIPLNGYYEWQLKNNIKLPFFIHIPTSEPIYMAGIWKYINFSKSKKKNFTIITKNSNKNLNKIHNRMPILLSINEAYEYLNDIKSTFLKFNFTSCIESDLDFYPVSKFVNNPINNSKECIKLSQSNI
ncbi:SOS response-associated peptidase [Alphaproteobacteria bacterium]|nr:SOS response-associated peptidase [Alphaproteobacteria bacterium]